MAEQVLIQFRADKALKQEVTEIYEQLGMDLPTAFRMFMKRSKQVRGLPFEAVLPEPVVREDFMNAFNALRAEAADLPEMSLDEIDKEISSANTVQGSEVINAINKYASSTITVTVKTKANATGKAYTGAYTDPGVSDNDHVNEAAMFSSTVSANTNGEVTGITFTQK
jgi:DNA-damage-inducible protein J